MRTSRYRAAGAWRRAALAWLCAFASVALLPSAALPAEMTERQSAIAAKAWLDRGYALGDAAPSGDVAATVTVADPESGAEMRVVSFDGGGFVVTSADDLVAPVIAFSGSGEGVDQDDENPFWALLRADIAAREAAAGIRRARASGASASADSSASAATRPSVAVVATRPSRESLAARRRWADLLGGNDGAVVQGGVSTKSLATLADVRVPPLVGSKWAQGKAGGRYCWNSCTPSNYVCGCVSTAFSQIMRYWRHPTAAVTPHSYNCKVDGITTNMTMLGGTYDWDNMPLAPGSSYVPSETQCLAIGKLTYDVGVTVQMSWMSGASAASTYAGMMALKDDFGYASAVAIAYRNDTCPWSLETFKNHVCASLDAKSPVAMSVPGHAVVTDGYGFSGDDFYIHVNYGWNNGADAWYCPPDFTEADDDFNAVQGIVANIFPSGSNAILSGRVCTVSGAPVPGATVVLRRGGASVASGTTDSRGIYAIRAAPGTYEVRASKGGVTASCSAAIGQTVSLQTVGHGSSFYLAACSIGNTWGNDMVLDIADPGTLPMSAPAFVSATDGALEEYVEVTWDHVPEAETYSVYRATTSTTQDPLRIAYGIAADAFHYRDTGCEAGVTYYYWVRAVNSAGAGVFGSPDSGWRAVPPTLAAAADNTMLSFSTGGSADWLGTRGASYDGVDSARSGTISHSQTSWMQATVDGPGRIAFWWNVSSEGASWDYLEFTVDGTRKARIGGTTCVWSRVECDVAGAGSHALRWNYRKDYSVSSGDDCGWVDMVEWTPEPTPTEITGVTLDSAAGMVNMSFPVRAGLVYKIQRKQTLDGQWETVRTIAPTSQGNIRVEVSAPRSWGSGFFRVKVE